MELNDVKQALCIDFDDHDEYINGLMAAAKEKAESITGIKLYPEIKSDYPELYNAILNDISVMYQNRGESSAGSETSIKTYRRLSRRPML